MRKDIVERAAGIVRESALKTTEEILKARTETLTDLMKRVMPGLAASLLSTFSAQFALACLAALADKHRNERILEQLDKLVSAPLQTGLLQLRMAIELETNAPESPDEKNHRNSRYQDALRKLDEALTLAKDDEQKATIHLMRAIASSRITGAHKEAKLHAVAFASVCESLAANSDLSASSQDASADRNEKLAAAIPFDGGMGGGGGAVGWSMAADKIKKRQLEYMARSERQGAGGFRERSRDLREASEFLLSVVP
jgi:hypothetical protein